MDRFKLFNIPEKSILLLKILSVSIYCEWLKVLTEPNDRIPLPIRKNPEPHVRRMLEHLQNLFIPRQDTRFQENQEQLCRKVLRTVVQVVRDASLDPTTWEVVLMFLLRITDTLLAKGGKCDFLTNEIFLF